MKFSNNNFLLFVSEKETASEVTELIRKRYPVERNNLIVSASTLSGAADILRKQYEKGIFFDIIVLDLRIPLNEREEFVGIVTGQQANQQFIMVSFNTKLSKEEKKFIEGNKVLVIPDVDKLTLLSLFEAIFEKKFNEKKYNLINRIDDIVNLKVDCQEILDRIAHNTLDYLNLKTCWISLVDNETEKLKIAALTGFGDFEDEYRRIFDISLSDTSVTVESILNKRQVQYEDVLAENCPFKYKDFARKSGIKSILITPIEGKEGEEKGKIVGTLNLYTYFPHIFQDDEKELARIIADKIAVVLSMKGMYEEEKKEKDDSGKRLDLIEKVAAEINRNVSDCRKVFKTIVDEGIKLVQADRGCIKVYDKNRGYISREYPDYCQNVPYRSEKLREYDITSYVIKNRKPIIIPDIDNCEYKDPTLVYKNFGSRMSVPLWSDKDKDVIGVLTAEHNNKNYFNKHHLRLFDALAKHAVIAIENTKRYKELQKRVDSHLIIRNLIEETSKLQAIEDEMMREKYRTDQLDQVIKDVIQKAGKIFGAKSGFVVLAGFKSNYVIRNQRWQFGLEKSALPELEIGHIDNGEVIFNGDKSITGKVIADGQLYNCQNVKSDPYYLSYGDIDTTKSEIVVPLKFQNQTFGAFALDSIYENSFSTDDEEILESIATQMALLIKRFGYLNKLLDLNKPFKKIDELEHLYSEIITLTVKTMETKVCYLRILDRNRLVVKGKIGLGKKNDTLPLKIGEGIAGIVAQMPMPKIIENVQIPSCDYKYKEFAKENNLFAMISVPIVSADIEGDRDLIGVLNTYANRICNFTSLDLQLMLSIAEKAGEAIKKARLIKQLDSIAKVDEVLTTTTESGVLKDITKIAKDLLDADQVVLYQYNSNIEENFGFSTPATTAGNFTQEEFKSQAKFTKDSLLVFLLKEEAHEFFVESYEVGLMKNVYKNRDKSIIPFYQREGLKSVIIFKLTYKEEVVGILFINYRYPKCFSQEEKQIAKTFANNAAVAISTIRRYEDIDRLHDIGNTITSESSIGKILEIIALKAKITLRADSIILYKYDSKKKEIFEPLVLMGNLIDKNAVKEGEYSEETVLNRVIRYGHDVFASDVTQNDIFGSGKPWEFGQKRFIERENIQSCAALLLKVKNRIVGLMFINYKVKQKFDPQQKRIIKIFADQASITIRNANLIEESKQAVNRIKDNLTAIQQSGNTIVKNLRKKEIKIRDILQPTVDKAMKLINVDMGYIGVIKKDKEKMEIMVCSERYKKLKDKLVDYIYEDSEWVKTHKRFDIHSKDKKDSDYKTFFENPQLLADYPDLNFTEDKDIKSVLRVPIYSSDKELLGMIVLESEKECAFSENDAYTVVSLANQASLAFQNYRLIHQLKKLREIDTAILKEHNDLDKVLNIIIKASLELVKKKHADIKLLRENGDLIIKKSSAGETEGQTLSVKECLSGIAIDTKKPYYERNTLKNARFLETLGVNTKSELVIPLLVDERPIGVLNIESEKLDDFTKENITVLEMLSGQAAIAIHLAQQKDKLIEKEREASIGYVTRESVHWIGNKIGPISRGAERIGEKLVELFLHNTNDEKQFEFLMKNLELIKKGAESALSIKSDLIDPGINKERFDLIKLLDHCSSNFKKENSLIEVNVNSQTISLSYEIEVKSTDVKTFRVNLDKSHIERMFHYMIKNAYQALEDRIITSGPEHGILGGKVEIVVQKSKFGLEIDIKDNGCGIPEEDKNELFRPFFTKKGADRGSGVGLYFCKRTMEELGGKIFLKDTKPGFGTVFCLHFPGIRRK